MRNEGIFKAERQDNMGEISGVMRIKVNGEWLPVASIVGPTGERGPTGPGGGEPGDTGPTGPQGPTGPTGEMFKYEDLTPSQVLDLAGKMGRNKADIVADATAGDLAGLDAVGNLVDSGIPAGDVLRKSQMDSTPTAGSLNPVTSDGIKQAIDAATPSDYDQVRSQVSQNASDIGAIEEKIPPQASAQNQLADKEFVNSSIATNTATFRGTYNLVTDLGLTTSATHEQVAGAIKVKLTALSITPDHNDYCFVQVPRTDAEPTVIARIDRYKCSVEDGVASWDYEWSLNNSSFTANQWAAINSGITSALVEKLGALPTAEALATALAGKASTADATLTTEYSDTPTFSEWTFSGVSDGITDIQQPVFIPPTGGEPRWEVGFGYDGGTITTQTFVTDENATNLAFEYADEGLNLHLTATRTRTDILGYTLGSQSDKPLQPRGDYAPATNIAKSALASDVQTSLGKADTALQTAPVTSVNNKTGAVSLTAGDVGALGNTGSQTLNGTLSAVGSGGIVELLNNQIAEVGVRCWNGGNYAVKYLHDGIYVSTDGGQSYVKLSLPSVAGTIALLSDTMRFSTAVSYVVGDVVFYNGAFYRCTTAHTAGAWNASHFAEVIGGLSTGAPTAPTPASGDDSTKVATTAFVQGVVAGVPLRYDMPAAVALVVDNDAATLVCADRAVTNATIATGFSTLNLTFPDAISGKVRDFYLRIVVAAGESAPALSIPQGIAIENPDGAVPEIADGETDAASTTLVWFSETAPNVFTAKSETVKAVA